MYINNQIKRNKWSMGPRPPGKGAFVHRIIYLDGYRVGWIGRHKSMDRNRHWICVPIKKYWMINQKNSYHRNLDLALDSLVNLYR